MTLKGWDRLGPGVDSWSAKLWQPLADRLLARANPQPGERVFDACCGTGTSAIPAALAVGGTGWVDGVDSSAAMIELARRHTAEQYSGDLEQLRFSIGSATRWRAEKPYDLVLCGFGLFFLGELTAARQALLRLLRPGGRIAVSCWLGRPFEPLAQLVLQAAAAEGGGVREASAEVRNIGRLNSEAKLHRFLEAADLAGIAVEPVLHRVPLTASTAWAFVQGSLLIDALPKQPAALRRVRERLDSALHESSLQLHADALIGVATLPS